MEDEVIPILRVGNVAEAVNWYQQLGFAPVRDPDGNRLRIGTPVSRQTDST